VDHTFVDSKNLKTLEQYAIALVSGMISLKTLENYHIRANEIGILTEDLICRANTIVWDIRRDIKLYRDQLESVLELLPDTFNAETIIHTLKDLHVKKARQITRTRKSPKQE